MAAGGSSAMRYVLGPDNRIVAVDRAWDAFATEQGAAELTGTNIVGKPLGACIADPYTREICVLLFDAVRKSQHPVTLSFRCDSPAVRRFMRLTVDPRPDGNLEMSTTLERAEERPAVALLDPAAPRSDTILKICGWCKRMPLPNGAWVEVEDALRALGFMQLTELPRLSHGMCPGCRERIEAEISALTTD